MHVRVALLLTLAGVAAMLPSGVLHGQGRGGPAWTTSQGDAQRSAWIRTDGKLSIETMQKPGFRFLWKTTLDNRVRQLQNLTQPITLTNIISYAYDDAAEHQIGIRVALDGDSVCLRVEDDGRAFNPLDVPSPDLGLDFAERPVGGLGVHIVRSLMDTLEYRREDDRNILIMRKTL